MFVDIFLFITPLLICECMFICVFVCAYVHVNHSSEYYTAVITLQLVVIVIRIHVYTNTIASFFKVKISDFQTRFHDE